MKQDLKDTVEDPEEKPKTLFLSTVDLADTVKRMHLTSKLYYQLLLQKWHTFELNNLKEMTVKEVIAATPHLLTTRISVLDR